MNSFYTCSPELLRGGIQLKPLTDCNVGAPGGGGVKNVTYIWQLYVRGQQHNATTNEALLHLHTSQYAYFRSCYTVTLMSQSPSHALLHCIRQ